MQVKQNQVVADGEEVDEAVKDWISGGAFGSKAAVLVFRSCVLASSTTSTTSAAKPAPNTDGNAILLSKAKNMAKRLIPDAQPFNVLLSKNLMHNVMETFGNTQKYESNAYVVRHISERDLETGLSEIDGQKPRDIDAVLNDLNKVKLKKLNVINTTANIKMDLNDDDTPTSEEISINEESHCTDSPDENSLEVPMRNNIIEKVEGLVTNGMDSLKVLESSKMPANLLHVTYKLVNTETRLLHKLLKAHGLSSEEGEGQNFNLLWSGLHFKPDLLRSLSSYQRVNHFPRSYELTRKDKLFKNIEKMAYFRGAKHFDFIPTTFLMPREYKELCSAHYRTKGPWIVKPAASSRGRGIYIVNTPEQIPKGDNVVVAKYIDKPLLVAGHKCDLRLYVCVTSIDPLLIYLYEEGLVRIATVKYDNSHKNLWNPCMHLCNYSINKYHTDYIKCDDPKAGDVGHKWTLSALLRQLRTAGRNTHELMAAIEDLIVKSILSSAQTITAASRVFVPHFNNCFELFGYDILVDDALKPWLLEINLSPSLGCDTALDARVKSALLADTLTLVGVPAVPACGTPTAAQQAACKAINLKARIGACKRVHSAENMTGSGGGRRGSTLTGEEARMVRHARTQYQRRGGYVRIFPSQNSWQKYSQYLDPVTGVPVCTTSVMSGGVPYSPVAPHNYNLLLHEHLLPPGRHTDLPQRLQRYESVEVSSLAPAVQLSETAGNPLSTSPPSPPPDRRHAKQMVKQQIAEGLKLTPGEGRRAFGLFLNYVLKRISNPINDTAVQHADFVLKFLRKASFSLRMPFDVKVPPVKMCEKDRCAVIAKQLNDFLYMFYRETDLCTDASDQPGCVANINFAQFMYGASEADLEDVLLLALSHEGDPRSLLGETRGPLCIDVPNISSTSSSDTTGPHAHVLLRQLARIAPPRRVSPATSVTRAS